MADARVSEWDREYFRRIGEWKAESHRAALARAAEMTTLERIEMSLAAARALGMTRDEGAELADIDAFYARAKSLGLYRP